MRLIFTIDIIALDTEEATLNVNALSVELPIMPLLFVFHTNLPQPPNMVLFSLALTFHLALWGQNDVIVWAADGTGEFAEDDRFFGDRGVLLQAVVPVVHTHTHHLLRGQHRSQQLDV